MNTSECKNTDNSFPKRLSDIKKCPSLLFFRGNIDIANDMPCVAIIGSREASENSLKTAFEFGRIASEEGFIVVNGLAMGCDTSALKGALSVGGKCIVLLPGGLDQIYPKANIDLAGEILDKGGCLVSEYPDGTRPLRYTFVERDRLVTGICSGVIAIETAEKGGTMHTVNFARQQSRLLACYYSKMHEIASGNRLIVDKGFASPLDSEGSLKNYLQLIKASESTTYEQLSLPFL